MFRQRMHKASPSARTLCGRRVELYLGDEKIPTGNIGMANEPICYVLAVDNSVDETTLKEYRIALRRLISAKGAKDQIMLYTLSGMQPAFCPRPLIPGRQ